MSDGSLKFDSADLESFSMVAKEATQQVMCIYNSTF